MFNRIRVVTMLMMVLGVFALLQLVSGGLLFSSLQQNQQSFVISNDLRQQQSELTSTWDLMLQTRINLSRSSARMMMDASNQQSSAKNDLLKNAKASLAQAEAHYANFKKITPLPDMTDASGNVDEKYQQYHAALVELVQFLENGNMDAYFAQPTQGMQNALGAALGK
ncbi:TPA: Tar ligand binding domain-containing protein, partial [Klebsiella pneumoniae]